MTPKAVVLAGALLMIPAAHAMEPGAGQVQAPAQGTAAEDPDEVICRPAPPPTGRRLGPRRICATRAQWAQSRTTQAEDRQTIERAQQQLIYRRD